MKFEEMFPSLKVWTINGKTNYRSVDDTDQFVVLKDDVQEHCIDKKYAVDIRTLNDISINIRTVPPELAIKELFGWTLADIAKMIQWYKENAYDNLIMENAQFKHKVRKAIDMIRNRNCSVSYDGCEGSVGCCDSCKVIEDLKEELGL